MDTASSNLIFSSKGYCQKYLMSRKFLPPFTSCCWCGTLIKTLLFHLLRLDAEKYVIFWKTGISKAMIERIPHLRLSVTVEVMFSSFYFFSLEYTPTIRGLRTIFRRKLILKWSWFCFRYKWNKILDKTSFQLLPASHKIPRFLTISSFLFSFGFPFYLFQISSVHCFFNLQSKFSMLVSAVCILHCHVLLQQNCKRFFWQWPSSR